MLPVLAAGGEDWERQSRPARPLNVALVNMPWGRCDRPSIQCGLLAAGLRRYGHHVDVHYLNLELAARLGPSAYDTVVDVSTTRQYLLGEWLFVPSAWESPDDGEAYLARYTDIEERLKDGPLRIADLVRLRDKTIPAWVAEMAASIDWCRYDLVGFTSTFEQNMAALALARHIKERAPQVVTVFGGANLDGEMGPAYLRAFPCVDYAVSGEGDIILPVLAARLSAGSGVLDLPGVSGLFNDQVVSNGQAPGVSDMDALPEPDYSEYFTTLDRLGHRQVLGGKRPALVFEASRGCWWGEKHHCTFCGLNALGMAFRSKSPARVLHELTSLAGTHRVLRLDAVDNIIDMRYLDSLCGPLAESRWDLRLFFEVKANLTREQLGALRRAGITRIQPGLESLSSHILSLMRKGTTMLTNVRLLKWSRYHGLDVGWNVLTGFPGETDADYEQQLALVPSLLHLQPPGGFGPLWLERFSPYFTEDFPIRDVRPIAAYEHLYPQGTVDLERIAYFFDYRAEGLASTEVRARLGAAVEEWQERWRGDRAPSLTYVRGPSWLAITDTRGPQVRRITVKDWRAIAYEHCSDRARTIPRIAEYITEETGTSIEHARLASYLDRCAAERLMVAEEGRYLSLALPHNDNW
ncbi:RiPP maturation radical SAM C-methyltransferase [Spirillospora sp. CA-255316]